MTVASTWLLLHAASQWARTRTEAKLLHRIPHAAKHALAVKQQSGAAGDADAGGAVGGGVNGTSSGRKGAGGVVSGSSAGGGSRGPSSTGEPSAPLRVSDGDVPAKQQPAPLASV